MEQLSEIVAKHQMDPMSGTSLMPSGASSVFHNPNELSIYSGALTDPVIVMELAKAKIAFPALPVDYFTLLADRIKTTGFTDERLKDSVNHVIDTCLYPTPTIAQFISFDKRIKLLSYDDIVKKTEEYGASISKTYLPVKLPGRIKPVWIHIDDIALCKLEQYVVK